MVFNLAINWLLARLREPSTWAAIAVFMQARLYAPDWLLSPDVIQNGCIFVAAVLAAVLRDKASKTSVPPTPPAQSPAVKPPAPTPKPAAPGVKK